MKLYEAIEFAINQNGTDIICEQRFANYLADLQAYETPAVRRIIAAIMREGYCKKLYDGLVSGTYQLAFNDVSFKLTNTEGFQKNIVQFVLDSILYATHNATIMPSFDYNPKEEISNTEVKINVGSVGSKETRCFVCKKDIEDFYDLEAEAAKTRWEATMKLSIKERIRKRKAIQNVYLDRDFSGTSEDNYRLLKVSMSVNLADFKEGECLILHKENTVSHIKCRLNAFQNDDTIILEVFPPDMPSDLETYYNIPLLLDKDKVDLRNNVP